MFAKGEGNLVDFSAMIIQREKGKGEERASHLGEAFFCRLQGVAKSTGFEGPETC